ncbi:DUF2848 domain-containing protein [Robbsia sp. Bb-Pol-6]|uniref:DUF2848 domain-containing protein n=1 Tax=Robbsia betulipollinis TaxID=2981849 RepID=A0ABT3ZH53_9BURK|nr:DUF2848 domain-containing protein [Robbsia betulipollinis]MCY0385747.1 DUF2848 domain-containing protein [Robbsia betulipollinis]
MPVSVDIAELVIAGWAGRDPVAIQHHIAELAELGVAPPSTTPCFYRVGTALLTQAASVQMLGDDSGGEVECLLVAVAEGLLVTLASDHTDRRVEAYGVAVSKQVCAKPMGTDAWHYEDVRAHWDQLVLRAWFVTAAPADPAAPARRLYQEGPVSALLPPSELFARFAADGKLPTGTAMFCGTLAAIGPIATMRSGDALELELHDPVLQRSLRHRYAVATLPVVA